MSDKGQSDDENKKTFVTGEEEDSKNDSKKDNEKDKKEDDRKNKESEIEEQKRKKIEAKEAAEAEEIREEEEKAKKRQEQAVQFEEYVEQSGLKYAFQIVFTEIISKQIREDQVFAYTAMRLRQIGGELDNLEKGESKED